MSAMLIGPSVLFPFRVLQVESSQRDTREGREYRQAGVITAVLYTTDDVEPKLTAFAGTCGKGQGRSEVLQHPCHTAEVQRGVSLGRGRGLDHLIPSAERSSRRE